MIFHNREHSDTFNPETAFYFSVYPFAYKQESVFQWYQTRLNTVVITYDNGYSVIRVFAGHMHFKVRRHTEREPAFERKQSANWQWVFRFFFLPHKTSGLQLPSTLPLFSSLTEKPRP